MPKKKDSLIIGAVLLIAVVLFIASRVMPKTDLNQKTADVTLAPDAVEYLDATPGSICRTDRQSESNAGTDRCSGRNRTG